MEEQEEVDDYNFNEDEEKNLDQKRELSARSPEPLGGMSGRAKSGPRRASLLATMMSAVSGSDKKKEKHLSSPNAMNRKSGRRNSAGSQSSTGSANNSSVRDSAKSLNRLMTAIDRRRSSIMTRMGYTHTISGRMNNIDLDALGAQYDPNKPRPFSAPLARTTGPPQTQMRQNLSPEEKAWEERWTVDELPYYYNKMTEGVTWEKPDALKTDEELEHESGEWTWVPHPTNVWQGARVVKKESNGVVHCKTLMGAKTMIIPASRVMKDGNTNGREQRVPLWPLVKSSLYILEDDLVALDDPNEGLILHNLRARFNETKIYTWVGASRSVLVSLNPYKMHKELYSEEMIKKQNEKSPNRPPPPHVFGIASDALDSLLYDAQNNSILISGESGAGKTEATKHCLKFLAAVAGTKSHVEKRVLEANPILEAFGNAKTLRNNNSSRFGKWIEINFDSKTRQISGASITTYLLERSRVIYQSKGERSFHIFYQVVTNESFRAQYGLTGNVDSFRYLSNSGCYTVDGLDDAKELSQVIRSMSEMGFEENEQEWIFRTVCAVLHLGQIDFVKVDDIKLPTLPPPSMNGHKHENHHHHHRDENGNHAEPVMPAKPPTPTNGKNMTGSKVSNVKRTAKGGRGNPTPVPIAQPLNGKKPDPRGSQMRTSVIGMQTGGESGEFHLREAARLLGVSPTDLERSLCFRTVSVRNEMSIIPLSTDEARAGADSFAMAIYSRLFEWMVSRVNQSLGGSGKGHFIGVLDIFGFEIFEKNSFEQLCINFANEKLQEQFNASMFKEEEGLYTFEEINFEKVAFQDNSLVVTLIDGKPDGLLPQLDDEVRAPGGTDERWLSKMVKAHEKNPRFQVDLKKKIESNLAFQVVHYAGVVKYSAQGFVSANTDTVYEDMHALAHRSTDKLTAYLFPMEDGKPVKFVPGFTQTAVSQAVNKKRERGKSTAINPGGAQSERLTRATTTRIRHLTVSSQFRDQLAELLDLLEQTDSRYIRCVKPNNFQQGDVFDSSLVLEQLRYSGVFEAVEIRRKGFPFRWTHRQFVYQYKIINSLNKERVHYRCRQDDYAGLAQEILDNAPGKPKPFKDVRIGKTRVLYRAKEHKLFLLLRNLALERTIPWIQARLRGYIAKRMRRIFKECDSILQDAIDLENDMDALESAFDECTELIGPNIPKLFPRARPAKQRQAEKLMDELKQWVELETQMEELENDPREPNEIFFEMRSVLARCDALAHIPLTRRQERLVSNLRDKVDSCAMARIEERYDKMTERARKALESMERAKMKQAVQEFNDDKELGDRRCEALEKIKVILLEMEDLDRRVSLALNNMDKEAMKARLHEATKYPKSHLTPDMKECERLLSLSEKEFCQKELEVAIRDKDETRRIHREIRLWEFELEEEWKSHPDLMNHRMWRNVDDWVRKASFFSRMFGKQKIIDSFKSYSAKPLHFPLTSFGFQPDDPKGDFPERRKDAILVSKLILAYVLDGYAAKSAQMVNPDEPAQKVLSMGLNDPALREEIIFQLIRIRNRNPNANSVAKAEELLGFCLMTFPVKKEFEGYLYTWTGEQFGKGTPKCKRYWAALIDMRYQSISRSPRPIGDLRKEWEGLSVPKFALQPGRSSGPTNNSGVTLI